MNSENYGGEDMFKSFLDTVVCPKCKTKMHLEISKQEADEVIEGKLICEKNHVWIIKDGVINFNSQEQEFGNNWSGYYKNTDYEELDRIITSKTDDMLLKANELTKDSIFRHIKAKGAKKIIDIATGRGMLLTYLAEHVEDNTELVCVDLSHEVLKYDRLKVKRINPDLKVNFIACDATNLPFKEKTFDIAVSFFGIANMIGIVDKGIHEAMRVSKNDLINAMITIKDDNSKIDDINNMLKENNISFDVRDVCESNCLKMHKGGNKYNVDIETTFENIANENKLDLIPIEGEWFSYKLYHVNNSK